MPERPDNAESRRALLEKYLQGGIPESARAKIASKTASIPSSSTKSESSRVPVIPLQVTGSRTPFFYSHVHVKGGAFYSFTLSRCLGPDQPFYLLDPYRFEGQETPPTFEEMATEYIAAVRTVQPEGPYLLGGFCGGALIVFEMARQLREQGQKVDLLLLIEAVDGPGPSSYLMTLRKIGGTLVRTLARAIRLKPVRQLDWFLCLRYYYRMLRYPYYRKAHKFSLSPDTRVLRQDWMGIFIWMLSGYKPRQYPGKVTYFWASKEYLTTNAWKRFSEAQEREFHMIPGTHDTCRTDHLQEMAEHLAALVHEAQASLSDQ